MLDFLLLCLCATSLHISTALHGEEVSKVPTKSVAQISPVFPVQGNVYPDGYYYASVTIANKSYFLDIDTGSDLTWVQCDAPCVRCHEAPHPLYEPNVKGIIQCKDPLCASIAGDIPCDSGQCDYEVSYADNGSTLGLLLRDTFNLTLHDGSNLGVPLAFGCGYDQWVPSTTYPFTDGVLGLGIGKVSVVSQLSNLSLTHNVVGHCLNSSGVGFMFLGDAIIPPSGIVWVSSTTQEHYSAGPAELLLGSQPTSIKGISLIFDSGSSYTYFSSTNYQSILSLIKSNVKGLTETSDDKTLPVCWKGSKPFRSVSDVRSSFVPLALRFGDSEGPLFPMPPSAYLIISLRGNACLGILNGSEIGLGNMNVIGDISMQDKLVIYDNDNRKIGWTMLDCGKLPKP